MAYFEWKAEYSINIAEIDGQHRQLVKLLNDLYEAMRSGKGKAAAAVVLSSLIDYTKQHFALEEKMMQAHSYPGFLHHLGEHTRLTSKVIEYKQQFDSGGLVTLELSSFLKEWLITHIQGSDKKYAPFLIARGVK